MAYTLWVKYKKAEAPVLNMSFSSDGSVHLIDLVSRDTDLPEFEILTMDFPVDKVGTGKSLPTDKKHFYANHRLKFTHHQSGFFQVSGEDSTKIISGIDKNTGLPKGVSVDAFKLKLSTNDGGPFMTANIWGVNYITSKRSKTSEEIKFTEKEIDYQSMNNNGQKSSFAFLFFHLPVTLFSSDQVKKEWVFYDYKHYKKPLLLRLLKESVNHGYVVGVSCLKARADFKENFGFAMMGGAGKIDPSTGTCKGIIVIFPRSKILTEAADYFSLNR